MSNLNVKIQYLSNISMCFNSLERNETSGPHNFFSKGQSIAYHAIHKTHAHSRVRSRPKPIMSIASYDRSIDMRMP